MKKQYFLSLDKNSPGDQNQESQWNLSVSFTANK